MRFILQSGSGKSAKADATMLAAMGLPGGGIVKIGDTHVRVVVGKVDQVNALALPPFAFANGAGNPGESVDGERAVLPAATSVTLSAPLPDGFIGTPVAVGDTLAGGDAVITVTDVKPGPVAVVAAATRIVVDSEQPDESAPDVTSPPLADSTLVAGLEDELDLLMGWLTLLTSDTAERSRPVAGLVVSGPAGCGSVELVEEATRLTGLDLKIVDLRTVTTAELLLTRLEAAVTVVGPGTIILVDAIDPLASRSGGIQHQVAAVMRWFLDKVAERDGVACVITARDHAIADSIDAMSLLPRTLTISPPSRARRAALLAAELSEQSDIDLDRLANATAGFSALDIAAAVLEARASARNGLTTEVLLAAIGTVEPSLGTVSLGEIPSYGFDKVANLVDVKRILTESVIWQLTEPERFSRMGIEAPKGILLHGPPGTGKTFVIRALAHESGAAFFSVKGAELLDKWVGESERGVREVFARAKTVAPSIIFFDELDALAPVRGSSTNNVTDSVVAALLTELDGVGDRGDVFAVGATNRKDLIDPALLRPGRLEVHVLLGLPAPEARDAFLAMTSVPMADDVNRDDLVAATEGASFADLEGMLRTAAIAALRRDSHANAVTMKELLGSLPAHLHP